MNKRIRNKKHKQYLRVRAKIFKDMAPKVVALFTDDTEYPLHALTQSGIKVERKQGFIDLSGWNLTESDIKILEDEKDELESCREI